MNLVQRFISLFKKPTPPAEKTVDSILSTVHEKLQELEECVTEQQAKAVAEAKKAEEALAAARKADAEAVRAKAVHNRFADILGIAQVPPTL